MKIYTFEIEPMAAPRPRLGRYGTYNPKEYTDYKGDLKILAKSLNFELKNELRIQFYLPMPKSWSTKKRLDMNGKPHMSRPDADNLAKATMDSLSIKDDGCIWHLDIKKFWADSGKIVVIED